MAAAAARSDVPDGLDIMSGWAGARVLITGATGMVGSSLAKRLVEEGAHVVALVRDADPQSEFFRSGTAGRTTIINGALEDYTTVERAVNQHETAIIFHLAAQTIVATALRSPLSTFEANIRGTYHLLEVCRRLASLVRVVVVASSDKAYGESETLPYTEDMPPLGRHPYDVSKSCADLLAQTYAQTYGSPVVIARCGNIYGGGDLNWSRMVPGTIRSALCGKRPVLRSDGTFVRDYIFVDDVVEAYLTLAHGALSHDLRGRAYNFGTEGRITALEMMQAVLQAVGAPELEPVVANSATAEIRDQCLDTSRARDELGWTPRYPLEEGLRRTVEWYREFFAAWIVAAK